MDGCKSLNFIYLPKGEVFEKIGSQRNLYRPRLSEGLSRSESEKVLIESGWKSSPSELFDFLPARQWIGFPKEANPSGMSLPPWCLFRMNSESHLCSDQIWKICIHGSGHADTFYSRWIGMGWLVCLFATTALRWSMIPSWDAWVGSHEVTSQLIRLRTGEWARAPSPTNLISIIKR
jgi:hypothetical protein